MQQMENLFILFILILIATYLIVLLRLEKSQKKMALLVEENAKQTKELSALNQKKKNPLGPILQGVKQSITIHFNREGKILFVDDHFLDLLGFTKKELIHKDIHLLLEKRNLRRDSVQSDIIQRLFAAPKLFPEYESALISKQGTPIWISWTNKIIYNKKGAATEIHSVGFDITQRKKLETDLKFLATIDPQTGLMNRQAFLETGMRELKRSIRYKHPLSVLLIQLKLTQNNHLNLEQRDSLFNQMAKTCKKTMRDVDYLGRIGEVDLAFLMPETEQKNVIFAQKRIEEHLNAVKKEKGLEKTLQVNFASAGYTSEKSIDEIIMQAYKKLKK